MITENYSNKKIFSSGDLSITIEKDLIRVEYKETLNEYNNASLVIATKQIINAINEIQGNKKYE